GGVPRWGEASEAGRDPSAGERPENAVLAEAAHDLHLPETARDRAVPAGAVDAAPDATGVVHGDEGGRAANPREIRRPGQRLQLPAAAVVAADRDRATLADDHPGVDFLMARAAGVGVVVAVGGPAQPGGGADVDAGPARRVPAHQQGAVVAHREEAAVVVGDEVQVLRRGRLALEPLRRVARDRDAPAVADADESLESVRERAQGPGTGYRCRAEDPVDPVVAAQRGGLGTDGEPGLLEVAQVAGPAGEDIDGVEVAGEGRIDRLLRPVHPVGAGMDARRVADRDEEAGGGALVSGDGV